MPRELNFDLDLASLPQNLPPVVSKALVDDADTRRQHRCSITIVLNQQVFQFNPSTEQEVIRTLMLAAFKPLLLRFVYVDRVRKIGVFLSEQHKQRKLFPKAIDEGIATR